MCLHLSCLLLYLCFTLQPHGSPCCSKLARTAPASGPLHLTVSLPAGWVFSQTATWLTLSLPQSLWSNATFPVKPSWSDFCLLSLSEHVTQTCRQTHTHTHTPFSSQTEDLRELEHTLLFSASLPLHAHNACSHCTWLHREVKKLAQGHTAIKWQKWDSNPNHPTHAR